MIYSSYLKLMLLLLAASAIAFSSCKTKEEGTADMGEELTVEEHREKFRERITDLRVDIHNLMESDNEEIRAEARELMEQMREFYGEMGPIDEHEHEDLNKLGRDLKNIEEQIEELKIHEKEKLETD